MRRARNTYFLGVAFILLALLGVLVAPLSPLARRSAIHESGAIVARRATLSQSIMPQAAQDSVPAGDEPANLKLSSHLAELARSVPQQTGAVSAPSAAAALAAARLPKSIRDALHGRMMRINSAGRVQVYILVRQVSSENLQALRDAGVGIERQDERRGIIQAQVPVTLLEAVTALPFVKYLRAPSYAIHFTGSVTTQGDSILQADQVRSMLHVDGTGVKVGVISDGIKGIFATGCTSCGPTIASPSPIASGDLPMATGTRNSSGVLTSSSGGITAKSFECESPGETTGCGTAGDLEGIIPGCAFPGAGAEGTALLEIVHDLAPGAQLYFANAATDLDFVQAVNYIGSNADIGIDDVGFVGLPYDGTSDVSQASAGALNNHANPLRGYFTSAGNFAPNHYFGLYSDSKQNFISPAGVSGDLHFFQAIPTSGATTDHPATSDALGLGAQPYDEIELPGVSKSVPNGGEVFIALNWDDPFTGSSNNYDLFLVDASTGKVVASSTSPQTGTQEPVEGIDYNNQTSSQQTLHILIQNVNNAAAARHLNLYVFEPECAAAGPLTLDNTTLQQHNYNTTAESVPAESDAGGSPVSVTSVAAVGATDIYSCIQGSCQPVADPTTIEPFSSIGPTIDGRTKPDITAVDGVSVTGAGSFENPFFGTSAAAPHAGGIAALLLQAASCLRGGLTGALDPATARATLRNLILNNADPLGSPTPNNTYGYGRISALNSANRTIPTAGAGSAQTASANTPTGASIKLDGTASKDPTGCALTYNWTGPCGTASGGSPSVNCPVGTSTESLTVSNNGVTLSNAASVQITVTDFTLAASPASTTVTAGSPAGYTITAGPRLGNYTNPITFSCSNLPAAVACSFSPSSLTPGASPVTATLTITTTARSAVPPGFRDWPQTPLALWLGLASLLALVGAAKLSRPPRRRELVLGVTAALLAAGLLLGAACGGGSSSTSGSGGTPAGTYSVSVNGTAGTLMHSANVSLAVQ